MPAPTPQVKSVHARASTNPGKVLSPHRFDTPRNRRKQQQERKHRSAASLGKQWGVFFFFWRKRSKKTFFP
ncbi:hypothetical protein NON00_00390 [Roseomonas sp. GC11]|uniref:hypothetical protein n=1 Tax=Roseomonas sp. GC11 TaxID=2950546 RepID=UPI00210AC18C|nr:hypothetical protein [Roseomonas sp. GC11]MCQ4158384.1 hypothetical protein [Roseomonas sp. GC11]